MSRKMDIDQLVEGIAEKEKKRSFTVYLPEAVFLALEKLALKRIPGKKKGKTSRLACAILSKVVEQNKDKL